MAEIMFATGLFFILCSVFLVMWDRIRMRRMICRMEQMIDMAMEGSFKEDIFDESVLSKLESKLAHYLWAGKVSMESVMEEKNNIKTLISDISHQTKTPISNLILYTELLGELELGEEGKKYVDHIHSQAEKLKFLVSSLVKLSRLETGILTLQPSLQSISDMLQQLEMEYGKRAHEKGLAFQVEKSDALAVFDKKWTMEALGNILDNGVKYTKSGGIKVKVHQYEMFLCIQIEDTGIGIPESEQAAIFGRFYRSSQVHHASGVGIGLFLARKIIAGEGGYIKVSSKPGSGSVFSVYLANQIFQNCKN